MKLPYKRVKTDYEEGVSTHITRYCAKTFSPFRERVCPSGRHFDFGQLFRIKWGMNFMVGLQNKRAERYMGEDSQKVCNSIGSFGLNRPSAFPAMSITHIAFLRLLGRLNVMFASQIRSMFFSTVSRQSMEYHLKYLREEGFIWRTSVRHGIKMDPMRRQAKPPLKQPYVYGLTAMGKTLLDTLEVEADQRSLDGLVCRDQQQHARIPTATLAHDLQVSWWCSALILELRRNAYCQSIFVQVEFVADARQRMDALIIIRIDPTHRRLVDGQIPWFDGTPCRAGEHEIRIALEVDRGTEHLAVLLGKAVTYRDLTTSGVYTRLCGGPVIPVFIAPSRRRVAQICAEWTHAWPDGWGVISTPKGADHEDHGTLWGDYRTLVQQRSVGLLAMIEKDRTGRVAYRSLMTLDAWKTGICMEEGIEQWTC